MSELDPFRAVDQQPDPHRYVALLEQRGASNSYLRLVRQFLALIKIRPGWKVLEIGCGTGVVARLLAERVGHTGRATGIDPSAVLIREARRLARANGLGRRVRFDVGDGNALHCRGGTFDASVAVTVVLHVPTPDQLLREMVRVTRPGGVIGVLDQDFGSLVLDHPDRRLTQKILNAYARRIYRDPWSGRTMFGTFKRLGLDRVRVATGVLQDSTCEPMTRAFLERRVETVYQWNIISRQERNQWLQSLENQARTGTFFMTLNFYGVVGVKPVAPSGRS